jgi:two-component system chemotaxis response regulator CheY
MAKIMVVDDTLFMRSLLKHFLRQAGHTVVAEAADGEEARRKYEIYKPDLVTMDITMDLMDGLEALKLITTQHKDAKVVMVSAMSQKDMFVQAVKNGAKHFIIKPVTLEKVVAVTNEVLGIEAKVVAKHNLNEVTQSIEGMKYAIRDIDKSIKKIDRD